MFGNSMLRPRRPVAAIAIANALPAHTCNPDDFDHIDGLTVIAVPHPDHGPSPG